MSRMSAFLHMNHGADGPWQLLKMIMIMVIQWYAADDCFVKGMIGGRSVVAREKKEVGHTTCTGTSREAMNQSTIKAICNHERTVAQEGQEEDADGGWGMQSSSVVQ